MQMFLENINIEINIDNSGHDKSVDKSENYNILLVFFVLKNKKLMWLLSSNAGSDEKEGIFFIWPYFYFIF